MERKDFGEANHGKFFLTVEKTGPKTVYRFEALPVRSLYDITLDQSSTENEGEIMDAIKRQLTEYAMKNRLFGNIVRLNISVNEKTAEEVDHDGIMEFVKRELLAYHCTGIHMQITAKRQLRKASITEKIDPIQSFNEYLELEEDAAMRERMRELGIGIISRRCKQ